jgi:hypothetical protein
LFAPAWSQQHFHDIQFSKENFFSAKLRTFVSECLLANKLGKEKGGTSPPKNFLFMI